MPHPQPRRTDAMLAIGKELTTEQRLNKCIGSRYHGQGQIHALAGVMMMGEKRIYVTRRRQPTPTDVMRCMAVRSATSLTMQNCVSSFCMSATTNCIVTSSHGNIFGRRIQQLANMACDYVINIKIVDDNQDGFLLP